jgi:AcrR family transcriptional regulator
MLVGVNIQSMKPYHHGDLRNALIAAARDLAERGGPDAVTIRAAAREVGVTPTAAYRHFAGHEDLLLAAKDQALSRLSAAMRKRLEALPETADPVASTITRLEAIGYGYVDFALSEPGLFRTAFCLGKHSDGHSWMDKEHDDPESPHQMLIDLVDELIAIGFLTEEQRLGAEIGAWSVVHGLAMLLIDGPLASLAGVERQAVVEATLGGFTASFWSAGRQRADGEQLRHGTDRPR